MIEFKIVPFYQLDSEMSMVLQFCGFISVKNSNKVNVEIIDNFYVIYYVLEEVNLESNGKWFDGKLNPLSSDRKKLDLDLHLCCE